MEKLTSTAKLSSTCSCSVSRKNTSQRPGSSQPLQTTKVSAKASPVPHGDQTQRFSFQMKDVWKEVRVSEMQAVNGSKPYTCIYIETKHISAFGCFGKKIMRMMIFAGRVQDTLLLMKFAWQLLTDALPDLPKMGVCLKSTLHFIFHKNIDL